MKENLNPDLQDRINQVVDIDWSKITPDMYVTAEQFHQELLDYARSLNKDK